jgi:HD-like signal output (HDOD) protein/CheY-like chemotaxis protein
MTEAGDKSPQRVLFVDDEPGILHGLARMLRPLRHDLTTEFVGTSKDALQLLEERPFDVVVSDLRMPGMDGVALLREVQQRHPHLIRIMFSGHSELEAALRAATVAHQFIAKPCNAEDLRAIIGRAVGLRELLADQGLQSLLSGLKELPALPQVFIDLTALLGDPRSGTPEIAKLVKTDAALCAKVLNLVNSAFFGLARKTTSIDLALGYLGTATLRAITLATCVSSALAPRARAVGYDLESFQAKSMFAAHIASALFENASVVQDAFAAALLQDIGEILLLLEPSEDFVLAMDYARENEITINAAERELEIVQHAHVGAYLLGTWGLPYTIVEAVAHHHEPQRVPHAAFEIVDAVYAATCIAEHYTTGAAPPLVEASEYLERYAGADLCAKACAAAQRWLKPAD